MFDEDDEEDTWHRFGEDDDDDEFGCLFDERCCMPGPHFTSECHTAEMAEEMMDEAVK